MRARTTARLAGLLAVAATATGCATGAPAGPAEDARPGATAAVAPDAGAEAAAALLAAWERSRTATFVVRSTFERRVAGGGTLQATAVTAQRPPDRLVRQDGAVTGRLGDRRVACTEVDGAPHPCADAGAAPPYADEVADEVAIFRDLVVGPAARYAVTADAGCFDLRLRVWAPAPPYGTSARLCFDPATGAPVRTEITRPEGVDVTVATEVTAEVAGSDLDLPG